MIRALLVLCMIGSLLGGDASATKPALVTFQLFGCECGGPAPTIVLGWRGPQPGTQLRVYRDSTLSYTGANPAAVPFNVYLTGEPIGTHTYRACTGTVTVGGFQPESCSQLLTLPVF